MHLLAPLAALLGIEVEAITERVRNTIIVNAVMLVLALVGVSFLVAAGFFALADLYGVIYAALILAGAFLLLALAVFLGTRIGDSRRRRELANKRRSSETGAFVTTQAVLGTEGGGNVEAGGDERVERVGEVLRHRGGVSEQRNALARERSAQCGVGEETIEACFHGVLAAASSSAKQSS